MQDRPNIVLLVNDHQAWYRHGWDGGPRPLTPNFDRLAAGGISFERSYCAVPLCGPSRRTLLTGLYPHNHGNYYNYSNASYQHEIYLSRLAQAGYRCFYFGKWHAGAGSALDFDCAGFSLEDYGNPYISPEYRQYLERENLPPAEHKIEFVFDSFVMQREFPALRVGAAYRSERYWCGEHAIGITTSPKETHEAFFLADMACQQLEDLAAAPADAPFHLRLDFWGPHQPYFPTPEFADLYDPEDIPPYGNFADSLAGKPDFFWQDPHAQLTDENGRFVNPSPLPWGQWQHVIARAYAHITLVDAAAGLVLDKLDALGLAENTLVIWTADHGDGLASHGGRFDKGSYLTEEVLRVPLIFNQPGALYAGQRRIEFVDHLDLFQTIVDYAGSADELEAQRKYPGRSFLPLLDNSAALPAWREAQFGEYGDLRMVRGRRYKLVRRFGPGGPGELFDLAADPGESQNLYGAAQYQTVVDTLSAQIDSYFGRYEDSQKSGLRARDLPRHNLTEAWRQSAP